LFSSKLGNAPPLKRGDPSVFIEENSLGVYYYQDGKDWIRLNTPAIVGMVQVEK
jgi:hypothetical protein